MASGIEVTVGIDPEGRGRCWTRTKTQWGTQSHPDPEIAWTEFKWTRDGQSPVEYPDGEVVTLKLREHFTTRPESANPTPDHKQARVRHIAFQFNGHSVEIQIELKGESKATLRLKVKGKKGVRQDSAVIALNSIGASATVHFTEIPAETIIIRHISQGLFLTLDSSRAWNPDDWFIANQA